MLKHEVYHLYAPSRETPLGYPEDALEPGIAVCGPAPKRPIDKTAGISLQVKSRLKRLANERDRLRAIVPGRSDELDRYHAVIYAAAQQVLLDGLNGAASDADSNDALLRTRSTSIGRAPRRIPCISVSAGPADLRTLLQALVRRDELI